MKLDFLIIGAQKSATTSLYMYLKDHPDIYMPNKKEIAFFSDDKKYEKGPNWYLNTYFSQSRPNQKKGEASPQYMSSPLSVDRIASLFPNIRLIAILRNPIDRAFSAYRMMIRRGLEKRSFDDVVLQSEIDLRKHGYRIATNAQTDEMDYVRNSFYGQILSNYLQAFKRDQIKVVFTEKLELFPQECLRELFSFLDVENSYIPENIHKKFHKGGVFKYPSFYKIMNSKLYKSSMKKLKPIIPARFHGSGYWLQQWNTKPTAILEFAPETREKLYSIFVEDIHLLETSFDISVPWKEFHGIPINHQF